MYKIVKRYFDMGIYTDANVMAFVASGRLTLNEYTLITGKVL